MVPRRLPLNLKPLQALIPHWSVVLVFILIAALGFLYYATVQRSTAHLIARNFVHLNEVSEVLAETIEVMKQVTRFADYYCSGNESDPSAATGDCLTDRLVASSPYVTESSQINVGERPDVCYPEKSADRSIFVKNAGITIHWKPRCYENEATLTVPFRNIDGLANSVQYYDTLMIAEDESRDVYFDSAKLELRAVPGKPDSYFFDSGSYERYNTIDALVTRWQQINAQEQAEAKTRDKKKDIDEDDKVTRQEAAFPQSSIVPVIVGGVDYLAFVQPVSSSDLGSQKLYVIGMVRESDFDSDRYSVPLSTSAVSLLFFVVLIFSLSLIRIVLIEENGVVGRWDLYVLLGSALGLVSLLALMILSLTTWLDFSRAQDADLRLVADRMSSSFEREIYGKVKDMKDVENNVIKNYTDLTAIRSPAGSTVEEPEFFNATDNCAVKRLSCASHEKSPFAAELCKQSNKSITCEARGVPPFASLFTLDKAGIQRGLYVTARKNPIKSAFNLSSRGYFQRARNDDLWTLYPPAANVGVDKVEVDKPVKFYLDRIKSRSTGELETVLVTRALDEAIPWIENPVSPTFEQWQAGDCLGQEQELNRSSCETLEQAKSVAREQATPVALVAITSMRSLEETVLPPGFGYIVIESTTGRVLYHHDQERSLLENFYDVIGHDLRFKTHIATGLPGVVELTYKGEAIRANVQSLASLPLSVVTYYEFQPIRTFIFQFSVSAFVLVLMFLVYQFIVLTLLERLGHYLFGPPTKNRESPVKPMWQLNIALGVLTAGYLAAGYLLDNGSRLFIVLLGPVLVYGVARCFGARFMVWVMSGPSRIGNLWHQNPVLGARWTAFFLSLLLGVLPTIAIFYESMNLHEYSWRRFNNWSDSYAISRRVDFYTDSIEQLAFTEPPSPAASMNQVLTEDYGIYLPNTQIWAPKSASEEGKFDCENGASPHQIAGYIESVGVPETRRSEINIWCSGSVVEAANDADEQRFIQAVLSWIPDMNLMRSMLERFSEARNSWLASVPSCELPAAAAASPGGRENYNFCWQVADRQRELNYLLKEYYPHRKFAGAGHNLQIMVLFGVFLSLLWLAVRRFLTMAAPIRLIQEIRQQSRHEFSVAPPRSRSYYSVIPALIGEVQKKELVAEIEVQYRLQRIQDDQIGPFLSVQEQGDYTVALLQDLEDLLAGHPAERLVREWLLRQEEQGKLCLLILSRVDVAYLRTRQDRGEVLVGDGAGDWELLLTGVTCVPFHKLTAGVDELQHHRLHPEQSSGDDTLFISALGRTMEPRDFYRQWELCSDDEKIALGGLAHNRVTNVANVPSLFSLYNRGLITVAPLGINFRVLQFGDYVRKKFPRAEFRAVTAGYHDDKWRIFRAPLYILLGAVALFVAYSVQDEVSNVVKVFGGFGATLATIKSISERYRNTLSEE